MRYLVTGGAGFIGSNLVDTLLAQGHDVIVIDDFSSGKRTFLDQHKDNPHFTLHVLDFSADLTPVFARQDIQQNAPQGKDGDFVPNAGLNTAPFDAVFHIGAIPRVQQSIAFPSETNHANVTGTLNLLEACRKHGVKRFVYSSSSSLYGDQDTLPLTEDMKPNPLSPYALQKLTGEEYCRLYALLHGMETVSLRYFNVYGPRQDPQGTYACLIPRFIDLLSRNEIPTIFGDGEQTRDFTFVTDVVAANIAGAATQNPNAFGRAFNIGGGKRFSVNQVTEAIIKITGSAVRPKHGPAVIEPHDTLADISLARELLGWEPVVSFENGLEQTFAYLRTS